MWSESEEPARQEQGGLEGRRETADGEIFLFQPGTLQLKVRGVLNRSKGSTKPKVKT